MSDAGARVLVFDSGVGGLSIARSLWQHLPATEIVYLADNACFPYGDLAGDVLDERCVSLVAQVLLEEPCDLVVIACNTASTVVLPTLRERLNVPVVGVVPAIKPAAAMSRNRRIGLLATPATVSRPYLERLIVDYAWDCSIVRIGSSELVRLAEESLATGTVSSQRIQPILAPFTRSGVDTVVLGCTHFPLIRGSLIAALQSELSWVDSGNAIARRVAQLLPEAAGGEVGAANLMVAFYYSGYESPGLASWLEREQVTDRKGKPVSGRRISPGTGARASTSGS